MHALAPLVRRALSTGGTWRWPSRCWVCGTWPGSLLCEACVSAFAQPRNRCLRCALPLPVQRPRASTEEVRTIISPGRPRLCRSCCATPPPLVSCHAALDYDYPWNRCIAAFKYGHQPGLARMLGPLMWHAPGIAPALERVDLVVPMPLSRQRLRARGFNQAHELALELERHRRRDNTADRARGRYHVHLLHRLRDTQAQSALDASTRRINLSQACHVLPADHRFVQGRQVAVIDDIMTTGASLHEAARALLQAGARGVVGVVLARTPEVS
jgi:ComF family protein